MNRTKERLPRKHYDAVVIGKTSKDSVCVFAFGPDAHYEAVVKGLEDGCILVRRMSDAEVRKVEA